MKKTYLQPLTMMIMTVTDAFICGSQDITSSKGIDYGGVDEEGTMDPASRRTNSKVWVEEEEELEYEGSCW